ncbi:MAG: hypothetical protein ACOCRK_02455 [bacterium]
MKKVLEEVKEEVKLHIVDGIRALRGKNQDRLQAVHNFFEIVNSIGITDEDIKKSVGF